MRRFLLLSLLVCLTLLGSRAQDFKQGDNILSVGLGAKSHGIPILVNFEHCIKANLWDKKSSLGIGAIGGWYSRDIESINLNYYMLGFRGNLHYNVVSGLDLYGGATLGYQYAKASVSTYKSDADEISLGMSIGGRYYFTNTIAAYMELGAGSGFISNATIGITFKL